MSTRLDKLLGLLDSGSNASTRKAAADQIGEIARQSPYDAQNLLLRVQGYLGSPKQETRAAAIQAVDAIAKAVPVWTTSGSDVKQESDSGTAIESDADVLALLSAGKLSATDIDLEAILANAKPLLASGGVAYEVVSGELKDEERMKQQREILLERLGLKSEDKEMKHLSRFVNIDSIATEEDIKMAQETAGTAFKKGGKNLEDLESAMTKDTEDRMSIRQRHMARRAQKKKKVRSELESAFGAISKDSGKDDGSGAVGGAATVKYEDGSDSTIVFSDVDDWPFMGFTELLCHQLFHKNWEIRHSCAASLRSIVRKHGVTAGQMADIPKKWLQRATQIWLEDVCMRVVCVLALDQFGDYVSDLAVAPVRETAGQLLGVISKYLDDDLILLVVRHLTTLLSREDWDARHGGALGLKYVFAVKAQLAEKEEDAKGAKTELRTKMIEISMATLERRLLDDDDDVRTVVADAMRYLVDGIIDDSYTTERVVATLWDTLDNLDELTVSTAASMRVLAEFIVKYYQTKEHKTDNNLSSLLPRIYPFLRHSSSEVRKAAIKTLSRIVNLNLENAGLKSEDGNEDVKPGISEGVDSSLFTAWYNDHVVDLLNHVFQCLLLEADDEIYNEAEQVWRNIKIICDIDCLQNGVRQNIRRWLLLLSTPPGGTYDNTKLDILREQRHADPVVRTKDSDVKKEDESDDDQKPKKRRKKDTENSGDNRKFSSQTISFQMPLNMQERALRVTSVSAALAHMMTGWPSSGYDLTETIVYDLLQSPSAVSQEVAAIFLSEVAKSFYAAKTISPDNFPANMHSFILSRITEIESSGSVQDHVNTTPEFGNLIRKMRNDCQLLMVNFRKAGLSDTALQRYGNPQTFSVEDATALATTVHDTWMEMLPANGMRAARAEITRSRLTLLSIIGFISSESDRMLHTQSALLVTCIVYSAHLPEKITPLIKSLKRAVRHDENFILQARFGDAMAHLMKPLVPRQRCPNGKLISFLAQDACGDRSQTPLVADKSVVMPGQQQKQATTQPQDIENGIRVQRLIDVATAQEAAALASKKRDRKRRGNAGVDGELGEVMEVDTQQEESLEKQQKTAESQRNTMLQRRGSELCLTALPSHFMDKLWAELPDLRNIALESLMMRAGLGSLWEPSGDLLLEEAQPLIDGMQILEILIPYLPQELHSEVLNLKRFLRQGIEHRLMSVRHMSGRVAAEVSRIDLVRNVEWMVQDLLPGLSDPNSVQRRQGIMEAIFFLVEKIGLSIVPFIVFFLVPVLGRMSDPTDEVRKLATRTFAHLVNLMPLDSGEEPDGMTEAMKERKRTEHAFIDQLRDTSKIPDFVPPVQINAELRRYQQEGVNWLDFLRRYKLHGILCDDMGLGKTLQTICIMAAIHKENADAGRKALSIVVCPPTLTAHWQNEIEKFCPYLKAYQYVGPSSIRATRLREPIYDHDVIISTYDIVRNDIEWLQKFEFTYAVLDEGHIIRNSKSKTSIAVKQIRALNRLILSGTPVQNNVLDLWSLFDYLMPNFLGSRQQFESQYGRIIVQARDAKASEVEQEAGQQAMDALHRQIAPFVLRRMKEDVLNDLPPKIIQDVHCDMSEVQRLLYTAYAKKQQQRMMSEEAPPKGEAFNALRHMLRITQHPLLVLEKQWATYQDLLKAQGINHADLYQLQCAPKLLSLKQLLLDCGIGTDDSATANNGDEDFASGGTGTVISNHRGLIFFHHKEMIDIVEKYLLKAHMPSVSYLRLDGNVKPEDRQPIVDTFNRDPTIDLLLLTTKVGGLGLNLTAADTVIFYEHSWNPSVDIQAMDRAHRIGQKRTVNVYRLITRSSIEKRVMSFQKFKKYMSDRVIGDTASLQDMDTKDMLDLFNVDEAALAQASASSGTGGSGGEDSGRQETLKEIMARMDIAMEKSHQAYREEYDMDKFLESLGAE
eukprot:Clim_evm6s220 gene=Clim_evmTU6s220